MSYCRPSLMIIECLNIVLNVKVVVAAFNQEMALVGAFSMNIQLQTSRVEAVGGS